MEKCRLELLVLMLVCGFAYDAMLPVHKDSTGGEPRKAVVDGDTLVFCLGAENDSTVDVYVYSLGHDNKVLGRACALTNRSPIRWQIGHGAFWVSQDWNPSFSGLPNVGGGCLERIDLTLLSKGEKLFNRLDAGFSTNTPPSRLTFHAFDPRYFLYFDYLPTGKSKVRQFITTNLTSGFAARNKEFKDGKTPASEFASYIGESHWDTKERRWKERPWKLEWSTPAAFREPFQALALGDDFYFVTRSGSLFRAAKPAKGTDRTLARVWDGKEQPIKAFITDAGTGKTFLFVPPANGGTRPAFFELSDKPRLVEYDPKSVPLPPLKEPHRTVVHAARVLVALKKIKGAEKNSGSGRP